MLDATGTDRAVVVSLSMAAQWALWLMPNRPERLLGSVFIGPTADLAPGYEGREQPFEERYTSTEGWAKYNRHYWLDHYQDFLEFFFAQCFVEPHSTRQIEDCVGCPVPVINGTDDQQDDPAPATRAWTRALRRPKRALYLSSPIGLGRARRDLAIARELRQRVPGPEIDWLAQDPVTRVLEAEGERIHPASAWLANESAHIEPESAEHDLHAFQMVFHDVVREQPYDLWAGTRPGSWTTTCTRTPSRSGPPRFSPGLPASAGDPLHAGVGGRRRVLVMPAASALVEGSGSLAVAAETMQPTRTHCGQRPPATS